MTAGLGFLGLGWAGVLRNGYVAFAMCECDVCKDVDGIH